MAVWQQTSSVEAFDNFTDLPENADRLFEFIGGETVEVPSNPFASYIGSRILRHIANYVELHHLGYVTGEAGGYMVSGERYAPDVAYISKERQPELARQGYNPNPPDLAVEIDFPSTYQSQKDLRVKVANYLAAGTLVWVVLPETKMVEVYTPGQPIKLLKLDGVLDGGTLFPRFTLAVQEIFPE